MVKDFNLSSDLKGQASIYINITRFLTLAPFQATGSPQPKRFATVCNTRTLARIPFDIKRSSLFVYATLYKPTIRRCWLPRAKLTEYSIFNKGKLAGQVASGMFKS